MIKYLNLTLILILGMVNYISTKDRYQRIIDFSIDPTSLLTEISTRKFLCFRKCSRDSNCAYLTFQDGLCQLFNLDAINREINKIGFSYYKRLLNFSSTIPHSILSDSTFSSSSNIGSSSSKSTISDSSSSSSTILHSIISDSTFSSSSNFGSSSSNSTIPHSIISDSIIYDISTISSSTNSVITNSESSISYIFTNEMNE